MLQKFALKIAFNKQTYTQWLYACILYPAKMHRYHRFNIAEVSSNGLRYAN